ncbi:MAG: DUF1553 domain-containing protein [Gemmataceae bacterium]
MHPLGFALSPALAVLLSGSLLAAEPVPTRVEFNRDIRPILSDACFSCHGPDARKRKADLRLDVAASARTMLSAGKPHASSLFQRLVETDNSRRMPPVKAGRQLSAQEIELIRRWIEQGAAWQEHWAFLPPRRPAAPRATQPEWNRNPIDGFIRERLDRAGWTPAPEADRATLLRRVTLDLTGLPPTVEEAEAFLADERPGAYERVVERLLASPRFGERMAIRWLDAARYADTNGYQTDAERFMWRWRDWVIDAYNHNVPFDRFTVEQLAGDLLPGATLEQRLATGFNRNHRGNSEGGIIPEEYAVEYVADRVETTATVWLGLTMMCARCHDHKYDPMSMRDYYGLFAVFNNVPERGRALKYGNSPPVLPTPTRLQQEQLARLRQRITQARQKIEALSPRITEAQTKWEKSIKPGVALPAARDPHLQAAFPLDGSLGKATVRDGAATWETGKVGKAAAFDGKRYLDAGDVGAFGFYERFSLAAWMRPEGDGTILSRGRDAPQEDGYGVGVVRGRVLVHFTKRWLDDALRVETESALQPGKWQHLLVVYDGSRVASGVRVYVDGQAQKLRVLLDELNQPFASTEPFRIGGGGGTRFRGGIGDVRIWTRALTAEDAVQAALPERIEQLVTLPRERRSAAQQARLQRYFLATHAPTEIQQAHRKLAELEAEQQQLLDDVPTTMVMEELPQPRATHLLQRGQYDHPGERVEARVPESLPKWTGGGRLDRLALARWLVDPTHPLTSRVAVNRLWQMLFGQGLVKTVDDFGAQGEWPSHPNLLDWLAVEFTESGWDTKHLLRLLVTSATYRQSSQVGAEIYKRDPENRLLGRGPRLRLSAEMIRDQALAASGLLAERLGGPSVKPYMPPSLWKDLADADYVRDQGEALYRRGLYVFWKRTAAPPGLVTFDAGGRETCTVRESRTNTPLQALTLLNDLTYVEAARVLAQRAMQAETTATGRVTRMFRLVLTRSPRPAELEVLVQAVGRHQRTFASQPQAAARLLQVGDAPLPSQSDRNELAAYTAVASVLLNLDEAITKE